MDSTEILNQWIFFIEKDNKTSIKNMKLDFNKILICKSLLRI